MQTLVMYNTNSDSHNTTTVAHNMNPIGNNTNAVSNTTPPVNYYIQYSACGQTLKAIMQSLWSLIHVRAITQTLWPIIQALWPMVQPLLSIYTYIYIYTHEVYMTCIELYKKHSNI